MAYLAYYAFRGAQIIRDEEMEAHKRKQKDTPSPTAQFPLTKAEAKMDLDQLMLIYPNPTEE